MGFRPGHTLAAVSKAFRKCEGRWQRDRDTIRCAQIGNSFHTLPVSILLGSMLAQVGFPEAYMRPSSLQGAFVEELLQAPVQVDRVLVEAGEEVDLIVEQPGVVEVDQINEFEAEEWLEFLGSLPRSWEPEPEGLDSQVADRSLGVWMVESHVRSVDPRGAEVRLDLGTPMQSRPQHRVGIDARRWTWRHVISRRLKKSRRHINALELQAVLLALEWRLRSRRRNRRFLHLIDSQVALNVLCKGRTSSLRLVRLTRAIAARTLAGNMLPVYAYVRSALNPSDAPSRGQ